MNSFDNEYALFWVSDSILFFEYKPNVVITLAAAKRIVADRLYMQNEIAYPIFCDIRGIVDTDKAGREYLAKYGSLAAKAVSILAPDSVSNTIISFYVKINKPEVPTKVFTNKAAALAFLQPYI